jgi:CubicO group peptidase (beta-lactamase class C family)
MRFLNRILPLWLSCAIVVTSSAAAAPAKPGLPATPIGRLAAAWIETFNSGDEARMRTFNEKHVTKADLAERSMEQRLSAFKRMSRQIGVLEVTGVAQVEGARIVVLATSATGERLAITVEGDAADASRLKSILIDEAPGPDDAPVETGPPMTESALRDSLDRWIDRELAADRFAGVVRIVDGERTIYERAAGLAERRFDVPNTFDTKFNIGSITKLFTKIGIAKLMEQGKLAPEDHVSKFLPDYPKPVADQITIQQLLDHTSGLGDIFGPEYDAMEKSGLRSLSDFLPLFENKPLKFEPGKGEFYSNAGYTVLGLVIERVSGMPYHDFIRRTIYEPAGMIASGPGEADAPTPNLATGYTRRARYRADGNEGPGAGGRGRRPGDAARPGTDARRWELRANTYDLPGLSSSAGGGYSTAGDLIRFAAALRHDRILSPAYTQWVLGGDPPAPGAKVAPTMQTLPPGAGIGIAGGAPGLNALLVMFFRQDLTTVVLANADPPIAEELGQKLRGWTRRAGLVKDGS